jgi:hypothetical protein
LAATREHACGRIFPWYVPAALGGNRTSAWRSRYRALAIGLVAVLAAISISACGGGSSSDSNEPTGTYEVKVTEAEFPAKQQLGQTSLMRIGVRNTGTKTISGLTVTASVGGEEGQSSSLPFAIHDPEPGLAQPDRPVWVLAARYPKRAGDPEPGGTETASPKTFDFGPLKPDQTVVGVWKLTAVKEGNYNVLYSIDAGLSGSAQAETAGGAQPGGTFAVRIVTPPPNTIVTDSGEVVEIPKQHEAEPAR